LLLAGFFAILWMRASADDCSPSAPTDGFGAVVFCSADIGGARILLNPVDELVLGYQQPLADFQGGEGDRLRF
ncbi:MAG: hypothetical protein RR063_12470, partial [Anaerovoracaceae bacterium]